jgi:twitching motility protein PilI
MAKRTSLRDFQNQLIARLGSAQRGETQRALLGVESGSGSQPLWLLDLGDAGEIVSLAAAGGLVPVTLAKPWYAGVVNIRGNLYSVVDFSSFRGDEHTTRNTQARLLLVGARHGINSALLVKRTLGLRPPESLLPSVDDATAAPSWQGQKFVDTDGRPWFHLNVPALLNDPEFLDITA